MEDRAMKPAGASCEATLTGLRKKHEVKSSQPLPAKSTVGIVLEGTMVNIIVPGSPGYHANTDGLRIEPGDVVTAIDGAEVTKADIIPKLRAGDMPGSSVTVSVLKKDSEQAVDFRLTRADMRSVMNLKDLYLAMGELHTEMEKPRPERLKQKIDVLEKRVQAVTHFNEEQQMSLQGHIGDLEDYVRDLYERASAGEAHKEAMNKSNSDLETLKAQHVALLEETDTLKQKLAAATSEAREGAKKVTAASVVSMLKGAVSTSKQLESGMRADAAEGAASEAREAAEKAEKDAQRAREDLQRTMEEAQKIRRECEQMKAAATQELQQAREESERLRNDAAKFREEAMSATSRADGNDKMLQMVQEESEKLRKDASQLRTDLGKVTTRAEAAEKQTQQIEKERDDLKRQVHEMQAQSGSTQERAKRDLELAQQEIERLKASSDKLGREINTLREAEKLVKVKLEASERKAEEFKKGVEDVRMQLDPLQATEKSLIAQLSAEKGKVLELERKMKDAEATNAKGMQAVADAKKEMGLQKEIAEQKVQEAAEAQATAKSLQRQVEQAQVQIKRIEQELQNASQSKESGDQSYAMALQECQNLREEVREKQMEVSGLQFKCEQAKDQADSLKQQLNAASDKLQATQAELAKADSQMSSMSEETAKGRILVQELEKALANKDNQISAQIKVLRQEREDLFKVTSSLREERRHAREELQKQKIEINNFRGLTPAASKQAAQEAEGDKVDIRSERRIHSLEKALEKSERDRATLEERLRKMTGPSDKPGTANNDRDVEVAGPSTRPDVGSLPFFNTRNDDIAQTALAALTFFVAAGVISYLQVVVGGDDKGGLAGAVVVMCGLTGFVLFLLCLFKVFLYLFGANSDKVLGLNSSRKGYLPLNTEPGDNRKVMPTPPSCTALDTLPVPDAATLQFLTTGRSSASDQQPNCSNQQTYYQSQFHAPLSPGATRKLSPRGQGLSGWDKLDSQRKSGDAHRSWTANSGRSRGSRPLDFV